MAEDTTKQLDDADGAPRKIDLRAELAKEGNWEAVARSLAYAVDEREADNARIRRRNRELKEQLPKDGERVLKVDEASSYDAFRESLGDLDTPEKVQAFREQAAQDAQVVADLARAREFKAVAEVTGTRAPALIDVFRDGEVFEIEGAAPKDGEADTRTVYVKAKPDGERVPFADYVDAHKATLKPALYAEAADAPPPRASFPAQRPGGRPPQPARPDVERYVEQKSTSGAYARM